MTKRIAALLFLLATTGHAALVTLQRTNSMGLDRTNINNNFTYLYSLVGVSATDAYAR